MAMGTESARALGKASRKLRDLATDSVVIPDAAELYKRACEKLADAKRELADLVAQQLKYEKGQSRIAGTVDAFVERKRELKLKVERAEFEAGAAKAPIVAARKLRELLPHERVLADAAKFQDIYEHCRRGTPEQIAKAQAEHDAALIAWRLCNDNPSRDRAMVKLEAARLTLMVAMGPPYSERRARMFSRETIANERKRQGLD